MKKLAWKNLLQSKCPKCKNDLQFFPLEEMLMCSFDCGFMIREEKMKQIIGRFLGKKYSDDSVRFGTVSPGDLDDLGNSEIHSYEDDE